ncbi:acylphosphatase [Marchantia polymorpha subsp. ruderalis]|nr:hypothetical protein MARPO_0013s0202 [Marchantia polymorpha]BBN18832.1 hypothetical protein Mp_8g05880 [Marchantia polymorpha subsp. ruderalis]|eukprot:PTQ46012.1 hypothetical protein MARPO_0013s0202 [Marchantia polymorpha]
MGLRSIASNDMVLRSSLLASGCGGTSAAVNLLQIRSWRRSVPSLCYISAGGRVMLFAACAGVRSSTSAASAATAAAAARGVVRMSATPVDGQNPSIVMNDENLTKSVMVRIKGKVQGVFYRNWTVETAKQLGVDGWVRNNKDGSVEAVFSGKSAAVDSLLEKCEAGPPAAKVSNVEATPYKEDVPKGFERRPTI